MSQKLCWIDGSEFRSATFFYMGYRVTLRKSRLSPLKNPPFEVVVSDDMNIPVKHDVPADSCSKKLIILIHKFLRDRGTL